MSGDKMKRTSKVACAAAAALLIVAGSARAGMIHSYKMDDATDSLGGPSLTTFGGTFSGGAYVFGENQGLSLSDALPMSPGPPATGPGTYSIDMTFAFSEIDGYRRILDFKNLTVDTGLYNLNSALNFFNEVTGPAGAFAAGSLARVVLTRDDVTDLVVGYVNGVEQLNFVDSGGIAVFSTANNLMNFFRDDVAVGGEVSPGFVTEINIYDDALNPIQVGALGGPVAVPEPSCLALWCLGTAAATGCIRRHRASASVEGRPDAPAARSGRA